MPRQARLDSPGTLHHVIIRGIEKKLIVVDDVDRQNFVDRLGRIALDSKTPLYAWALMTNHAHILLRSGPKGLASFMRRLLTSYAVTFNRRHTRHGHLFQNRYKSILCDDDAYFKELVRYIHLNPLRAKLVENFSELASYSWCGHEALMKGGEAKWHYCKETLSWFGKTQKSARRAYRNYVKEGISMGRRPDLVGGGLVRSQGGWSQVIAMRKRKERDLYDQRILGSGQFVEKIIKEAEGDFKRAAQNRLSAKKFESLIQKACRKAGVQLEALRSGSRLREVSAVRAELATALVKTHWVSMAECARHLGVSTPAIWNLLKRCS